MKKSTITISLLFISFIFFGCTLNHEVVDSKFWDDYRLTKAEAIETENYELCNDLPLEAKYFDETVGPCVDKPCTSNPRLGCLQTYFKEVPDENVCNELSKLGESTTHCLTHVAEIKNNSDICKLFDNESAKLRCLAYVEENTKYCYELEKDEHDSSLYPRSTGFCIGYVVLRTEDYTTCLKIDGPDYGEQWQLQRNGCLEYAAYFLKNENKSYKHICDEMVEDTYELFEPMQAKNSCNAGQLPEIKMLLPPDKS